MTEYPVCVWCGGGSRPLWFLGPDGPQDRRDPMVVHEGCTRLALSILKTLQQRSGSP